MNATTCSSTTVMYYLKQVNQGNHVTGSHQTLLFGLKCKKLQAPEDGILNTCYYSR